MREFRITLAGQVIGIRCLYDEVYFLCRDYLSDETEAAFRVETRPEDIAFELEKSLRKAALEGKEIPPLPPLAERCDTAVRQFELAARYKSERIACLEARKHYAWYLKGVPHAGYWKGEIARITTLEDVYRVTAGIKRELRDADEER